MSRHHASHDLVEVFVELFRGGAVGNGFFDRPAQVGQKITLGRHGYDKGVVMLGFVDIRPGASGQIDLATQVVDLFREWSGTVRSSR